MILENGDILTINNNEYLVVESARYEDVDYIFANKLAKEELTQEYVVMKKLDDSVSIITDNKILEVILPVFSNKIQKVAEKFNEQNKFEIND